MKKAIIVTLVLCLGVTVGKCLLAQDNAVVKPMQAVAFNAPGNAEYFKYEAYLVEHGKNGVTVDSWQKLSAEEQARKIAEGDKTLANLKQRLLSKDELTAEEGELFKAIWGFLPVVKHRKNQQNEVPGGKEPIFSLSTGTVTTVGQSFDKVSHNLAGYQTSGNWGSLFDGSEGHGRANVHALPVEASGLANRIGGITVDNINMRRNLSSAVPLPESQPMSLHPGTGKSIIVGSVALAMFCGFVVGAAKIVKTRCAPKMVKDEFDLDLRIAGAHGSSKNVKWTIAECGNTYGCSVSCIDCDHTNDTCSTCYTCEHSCPGTCEQCSNVEGCKTYSCTDLVKCSIVCG